MDLEPQATSSETTTILDDFRRIVRVLRESSRAAEGMLGVSGAQLFVLKALADAPVLSVNELAERTRTHQSTVSVVVRKLVERGFICRRTSESDARRLELELTQSGRALLGRAPLAAQDKLILGLENLPIPERKSLAAALKHLVQAMALEGEAPQMFFEEDEAPAKGKGARHG
jgi:MarR family transcriptional regulator, lower aerobic nicotinate degradation pathway regulator